MCDIKRAVSSLSYRTQHVYAVVCRYGVDQICDNLHGSPEHGIIGVNIVMEYVNVCKPFLGSNTFRSLTHWNNTLIRTLNNGFIV